MGRQSEPCVLNGLDHSNTCTAVQKNCVEFVTDLDLILEAFFFEGRSVQADLTVLDCKSAQGTPHPAKRLVAHPLKDSVTISCIGRQCLYKYGDNVYTSNTATEPGRNLSIFIVSPR
ncbi:hypothetical protein RRG08_001663 [Elysia crispata]|uniref:Uncharacterized protein n=1 Tax=Elysia crispata TaxID=231223 RepID=A0AAE1AKG0_9GAST|nr:hypothetical protein RRG08_001663 [Elysia crispata]